MTALSLPIAEASQAELRRACGEDPGLACRNVLDWTDDRDLAELAQWAFDVPLAILLILVVALAAARVVRRLIVRALQRLRVPAGLPSSNERLTQRVHALTTVLTGIGAAIVWTVATLLILGELGINLAPLLAGAGVVGVALGFGAQSIVRDVLAGIFILAEDQFGVGDVVDLDPDVRGTVEGVSLRTTRVRAVDGTVWHVPNGQLQRVGNMSQNWSRALLDLRVSPGTDLARARAVIQRVGQEVRESDPAILEDPEVWGVEELSGDAVVIRFVVKTKPSEQWRVSRQLRERIKKAFDSEGIELASDQA